MHSDCGLSKAPLPLATCRWLREKLGRDEAEDARRRFDLNRQVEAYLKWYEELIEEWEGKD